MQKAERLEREMERLASDVAPEQQILPRTQIYHKDASLNLSAGANTLRTCADMLTEAADLMERGRLTRVMILEAGVSDILNSESTAALLREGFPDADHYPDSGVDFAGEAERVREVS